VDAVRWALLGTSAPGPEALLSVLSTVVLFVTGLLFFRRAERLFADRI
jgi:ABC-type polysaccharide/polyol phosphate export permease